MKKTYLFQILFIATFLINASAMCQSKNLPYESIESYPKNHMAGSMIARMIDGLGYRYYWATDGLRPEDLAYTPSKEAQSAKNTLQHIYELSEVMRNVSQGKPNGKELKKLAFDDLRAQTLKNFKQASNNFNGLKGAEVEKLKVTFIKNGKSSSFPIWHFLNGPLADALYHTGQIVSFRRTTGNPINPNVSVFMGKNKK